MIENRIIDAMNYIDEDLLEETLSDKTDSETAAYTDHRWPRRRKIAAVIAAALILMVTAGFASGILTAPVNIFNTGKIEETTSRVFYYGKEVDMIGFDTQILFTRQRSIKGQVRNDANKLLSEKKATGDLHFHTHHYADGRTEKEYDDYYLAEDEVRFDSQESALDYIGCRYFEKMYFPYEKCLATVSYSAVLKENEPVSGSKLECRYSAESIDEKIYVRVGIGTELSPMYFDDGTYALELIKTPGEFNGGKAYKTGLRDGWVYSRIYEEEGRSNVYETEGFIVKNQLVYKIQISCGWEYQSEAEKIFDNWVASF